MRFFPYLGALLAVVLGIFSIGLSARLPQKVSTSTTSSTLAVVTSTPTNPITIEDLLPSISTSTPPAPEAPATTTAKAPVKTPAKKPATVTVPVQNVPDAIRVSSGNLSLDTVASTLRSALVNIICYSPAGSSLKSISGSGIIIDSRGVILTNAHVAQMFLLADRGVSCTIRTGSPATDQYKAALMFISPAWVQANASVITQTAPSGDGNHDYAFLAITGGVNGAQLPASFPSIPFSTLPPNTGVPVVIASYGAQFLQSIQIQNSLFPTIVFGSIKQVFTYETNTIDVFSLGGSAAAQEGSSGGGVADASGNLIGTITTSSVEGDTSTRNLDAITASYIRATYAKETGTAVETLLAATPKNTASAYTAKIPALEALITANLNN